MLKLDDYLRIRQAAEHLGVCRNTLRNWELFGKISRTSTSCKQLPTVQD